MAGGRSTCVDGRERAADRARRPPRSREPPSERRRRLGGVLEQGIYLGDNLELLARLADESFTLIYIDPPFNTGREPAAR